MRAKGDTLSAMFSHSGHSGHITSVVINQRFLACLAFDDIVNSYSSFNIN